MAIFLQTRWDEGTPEWQKESAINGVEFHLTHPAAKPEDSHNNWLAQKIADGWVFGEVKDVEAKKHPCMVSYEKLPEVQRAKDSLFIAVVHSLNAFNEKKAPVIDPLAFLNQK
jgi:hypothetical protein